MNICIIGAGNIGTYLAAYISMNKNNKVYLHTSKPEVFKETIALIEEEKNITHDVKVHCVTASYEEAVKEADYILITYPSFMMEKTINTIIPFLKKGAVVGAIPGFGGKEYLIENYLKKSVYSLEVREFLQ